MSNVKLPPMLFTELVTILDELPHLKLPSPLLKMEFIRTKKYSLELDGGDSLEPGQIPVHFVQVGKKPDSNGYIWKCKNPVLIIV